jgi:hypothetical protein
MNAPDSLYTQAARIASLTVAANVMLTGGSLADRSQTETIVIDLLDCAGILAAKLATACEAAETQSA